MTKRISIWLPTALWFPISISSFTSESEGLSDIGNRATVATRCSTDANNHTTCNVSVSASIAIYGDKDSGITKDRLNTAADTIKNSIEGAWSGSFTQDGVSYNVSTRVSVSASDSEDAAMDSGAQHVIAMRNGPMTMPDGSLLGAYIEEKSIADWLTGGPSTGMMDINGADNYAKHEFTHMLGVGDKSGAVLSASWPQMRPDRATSQDLGWGVEEATQSVGLGLSMKTMYDGSGGPLPEPFDFFATDRVGAPVNNEITNPRWK
ncbi:MAG TPA: hypothetical protein VKB47_00105 [Terracidiphilus sp.]|nr:hypothetical protein [Terracidiphilus sp.]